MGSWDKDGLCTNRFGGAARWVEHRGPALPALEAHHAMCTTVAMTDYVNTLRFGGLNSSRDGSTFGSVPDDSDYDKQTRQEPICRSHIDAFDPTTLLGPTKKDSLY